MEIQGFQVQHILTICPYHNYRWWYIRPEYVHFGCQNDKATYMVAAGTWISTIIETRLILQISMWFLMCAHHLLCQSLILMPVQVWTQREDPEYAGHLCQCRG